MEDGLKLVIQMVCCLEKNGLGLGIIYGKLLGKDDGAELGNS